MGERDEVVGFPNERLRLVGAARRTFDSQQNHADAEFLGLQESFPDILVSAAAKRYPASTKIANRSIPPPFPSHPRRRKKRTPAIERGPNRAAEAPVK